MLKIITINCILDFLSRILSVSFLRKQVINRDSLIAERALTRKFIRILSKSKNPFEEIERKKMYIEFNDNFNKFTVFNMCYISDMLGKALFAVAMGCFPCFSVLDEDGDNYFNIYFEPICDYKMLKQCKIDVPLIQKNTGNPHWHMNKKEEYVFALIYERFFVINHAIETNYLEEYEKIRNKINDGKLIGCVIRGTDYVIKKPSGHPIQPQIDTIVNELKKIVRKKDYIYLATEEKKILERIENIFPNQVISSDSEYYDDIYRADNINIAEFKFDRENDKFLRGFEYFRRVFCISKCDCYVGGESGAFRVARIMNKQKYEVCRIIWLGEY